jgi:hypothetical protein
MRTLEHNKYSSLQINVSKHLKTLHAISNIALKMENGKEINKNLTRNITKFIHNTYKLDT